MYASSILLAMLAAIVLAGCEPNKQAVPDPAQPPKPRVAIDLIAAR